MNTNCWLTASDLSRQFATGALSSLQVIDAVADRMLDCESALNALYLNKIIDARTAALESDARRRDGRPLSPLDGVPITLKENIFTQGDAAPIGTAVGSRLPKPENSPIADRIREAGLVLAGKTTMPDFGMLSSGRSSFHGTTCNPWQLNRNPGGSSSGAGAACAAGYGPLHVGTDIGGSIRLPASFCGIFGLKPSNGRVPIHPPYMGRVAGPMTRTVRDAAMLLDVIARPDPQARDYMNLPPQSVAFAASLDDFALRGKRIAVLEAAGAGWDVEPEVAAATQSCADALERHGAQVEVLRPFLTADMLDGICAFFEARSHCDIAALSLEARTKVLPFIVHWATFRAARFTGDDVMRFYGLIMSMREATVRATQPFDFVISPTAPAPAYEADFCCPGNDPEHALAHIAFTVPYNMSEQPAASINWTYSTANQSRGLPIGLQVAGQRFDDLGVLQLCRIIEQIRPTQRPWPVQLS